MQELNPQPPKFSDSFRPMLSAKIETEEDYKRLRNWPYIVSPKLDGIRTLLHPIKGPCTRTLKPIPNKSTFDKLSLLMRQLPESIGFDGELVWGEVKDVTHPSAFNHTQSVVMSHGGYPDLTYWIFDTCHPNLIRAPFIERFGFLREFMKVVPESLVTGLSKLSLTLTPHTEVENLEELLVYEQAFVAQGFEGIMIRNRNGRYKYGRSTLVQQDLIKIKRWSDCEGEIIGFEELMHNDNTDAKDEFGLAKRSSHKGNLRPANTLGTLQVQICNGPYKGAIVGIGSGFDAYTRQQMWDNQASFLHHHVTFKYQESGAKDLPRFPIFKGLRSKLDVEV